MRSAPPPQVDALVCARGSANEHEASRRLKSELLSLIDGVPASGGRDGDPQSSLVMVLATCNKPWDLDEAMRRRLERRRRRASGRSRGASGASS